MTIVGLGPIIVSAKREMMLGSLGLPEILFIFVIALLVFGPRRLPEIGRTLGKALGEFRRATTDLKRTFDAEAASLEEADRPVVVPAESSSPRIEPEIEARSESSESERLDQLSAPPPTSDSPPDTLAAARSEDSPEQTAKLDPS